MHTSLQLIELAKQRLALAHNLPLPITDYRLAKLLGLSTQVISNWKHGRTGIGPQFARTFALACELPEAYVYACIEHERTKDAGVLHILETIARKFAGKAAGAALAIVATVLLAGTPTNPAVAADSGAEKIYIMRRRRAVHRRTSTRRCSVRSRTLTSPKRARRRILSLPAPATVHRAQTKE